MGNQFRSRAFEAREDKIKMDHGFRRPSETVRVRGSAGFPGSESEVANVDDEIRLAVMNALHWDLAVPRDTLQVKVEAGCVTLSGRVEHAYSKTSAEADARSVAGVVDVTNTISVEG
jgi:osmotically-inducible protein OsmY